MYRVEIHFRNIKDDPQEVNWIVKCAQTDTECMAEDIQLLQQSSVSSLNHEIKVCTALLPDIKKFLASQKNSRAKFLLNLPDLVHHERGLGSCYVVLEDVSKTKNCRNITESQKQDGLNLGQFKVFLGTLAQFHAAGIAWNLASKDESMLDLYPFLHTDECKYEKPELDRLLDMYGSLLRIRDPPDLHRRLQCLEEFRSNSPDLLSDSLRQDMRDNFGCLALGSTFPTEVMFQYEKSYDGLFELAGDGQVVDVVESSPLCAALTTLKNCHYGHIVRDLAQCFFTLPNRLVRHHYMIFMLQSYCHVLTLTLELLEVDYVRLFKMTFHQFVNAFYCFVPHAVLRAILVNMARTDPSEVKLLACHGKVPHQRLNDDSYIPLTPQRVEFLVGLSDLIRKSV